MYNQEHLYSHQMYGRLLQAYDHPLCVLVRVEDDSKANTYY